MRRLLFPLLVLIHACGPVSQSDTPSRAIIADSTLPPMKTFTARAPKPSVISNADLVRDFMDLSFRLESGRALPVLTRFEGLISLRVTGSPPSTLRRDLDALLSRLRLEAGIAVSLTQESAANITIEAVPRSAIRKVLPQAACFVAPNVGSLREFRSARRSPNTNWALLKTRTRIAIFIPNDASPQEVRDCLHEEVAQALGPLNDLYRLPNSVFNDDNMHMVLTSFDMLILRATYAPELASGMTRDEVAQRLPAVFARINPSGRFASRRIVSPTPLAYVEAVQTALGPGAKPAVRLAASNKAIQIAVDAGWTDNRRAFAHYARGRLLQATNGRAAHQQYLIADYFYAKSRETQPHRAYVAAQLAAYALSIGEYEQARLITTPHIRASRELQNAALLSTLQLLRAEALEAQGRVKEADALRLDSLGWARYGFGADWAVRAKLNEIAALNPADPPV